MRDNESDLCESNCHLNSGESPAVSAVMFSAGVLGNLLALVLLENRRRAVRGTMSLFHILVTGLVITDLMGTCMISPVVLASYSSNLTLIALGGSDNRIVCYYFAFAMTFFSLATMLVLFAMALERAMAIGHPYVYEKFISKRCGLVTFPVIYSFCIFFCLFPAMGVGEYIQYCPGTWCFINMRGQHINGSTGNIYSTLYATLLLILIIAVLTCNFIVIVSLVRMHKRQKARRLVTKRERMSMSEEIDHLILLSLMTIIFFICSVPFTAQVYMNRFSPDRRNDKRDLLALRFISVNSIIDPWVFTVLRPSVLRLIRYVLCCQKPFKIKEIAKSPSLTSRLSNTKLTIVDKKYESSQKSQPDDHDKIPPGENT
ncbi:prostaglandin E receptor 2 S homeolog [Xenopus laevis]|uniref:Prostaglandin E2 receptor EP2 subtype n=1 Tax=Xenopus laevis TaxID=8355 RepID=Q6NZI5_XENLA|nr:prostaglandin E receptor 2 S homeolog [Xenopus laevis]AAH66120.1 MGC69060 protein [Xenopus laevis]